jgi:sigma-54-interacting transcriptional regulator
MSTRSPDALELLLPDAAPGVWQRAQRVTTFLRLLSNDSRCIAPSRVHVNLERAKGELERELRTRLARALEELLARHLEAVLGGESFLGIGEREESSQAAWSALEESREELPWLAGVPEPGEGPLEVALRLLECLERVGSDPGQLALWRARWARCAEGSAAGETRFRELAASRELRPASQRIAALAGVAECLLDRGNVRAARAFLEEHAARVPGDARLRRLLGWARLLQGDLAGARALHAGLSPWRGRLPTALVELRASVPDWLPLLAGRAASRAPSRAEDPVDRRDLPDLRRSDSGRQGANQDASALRVELGAAFVGVFALHAGGEAEPVALEASPGLRSRLPVWLEERDGACTLPSEPEHQLVVTAGPCVQHRSEAQLLRGVLDAEAVRSLALQPILDARGEVAGWLRIECEHHLLPSSARLAQLAAAWNGPVEQRLAARMVELVRSKGPPGSPRSRGASERAIPQAPDEHTPQAQVFRELVEELGLKTAQRSWWGYDVLDGELRLVAKGGQALQAEAELQGEAKGGGKALERALSSGGVVHFSEPDPGLAIQAGAASGLVLPLRSRERLTGLWAVESSRRRDFVQLDLERLAERVGAFGTRLRAAQFRAWHRARFGFDVHAQEGGPDGPAGDRVAAGRSRSPVVISGPAGCGKQILARWLHFESDRRSAALRVIACGSESADSLERALETEEGTVVLVEVARLEESQQARLLRWLDEEEAESANPALRSSRPRLLLTSRAPMAQAAQDGLLRRGLAERLQRLELHLAPLARRREEIPFLLERMRRRFAREEGVRAPSFSDEAVALLWRQSWEGNLRQLENLVYKLVLILPGRCVGPELIEALAERFQLELVRRLPSRHPEPEAIRAALRTTCNQRGSLNKTRAALYLGWDPDTLVSRMQELSIPDSPRQEQGAPEPAAGEA